MRTLVFLTCLALPLAAQGKLKTATGKSVPNGTSILSYTIW